MSFGITELVLILVIVLLLFGTTKLKSLGNDLGSAIKGFKSALGSEDKAAKLEADEPLIKNVGSNDKQKSEAGKD